MKKAIANRHQAIGGILLWLLATWLLAVLLCSCNAGSQEESARQASGQAPAEDIVEAVKKKKLNLKAEGDSGNILTLEITSSYYEPTLVTLAVACIARSPEMRACHDKLIVESPTYKLRPGQKFCSTVRTYSTSFSPRVPEGEKVLFSLEKLKAGTPLALFAAYLIDNPGEPRMRAAVAVWAVADKMPFSELRALREAKTGKPYVTGRDYLEALELLQSAGLSVKGRQFSLATEDIILKEKELLEKGTRKERLEAVESLAWFFKKPEAARLLAETLKKDAEPVLRAQAAKGLGRCGLQTFGSMLLETIEKDTSKAVRRAAAFALVELGDMNGVPLAIMFLTDKDTDAADAAPVMERLRGLTGRHAPDWGPEDWNAWWHSRSWLWLAKKGGDVPRVRNAMEVQRKFDPGGAGQDASDIASLDTEDLIKFLRELQTLQGRSKLSDPLVFEKVLAAGMAHKGPGVALNVTWILAGTKEPKRVEEAKKVLLAMLSSEENRPAHRDIIKLLGQWKVKEALEPLLALVEDRRCGPDAAEALQAITASKKPYTRRAEWERMLSARGGGAKSDFLKRLAETDDKLTKALSDLASPKYKNLRCDPDIFEALLKAAPNVRKWGQATAYAQILCANKKDPRSQKVLMKMVRALSKPRAQKSLIHALAEHFPNGDSIGLLLDLLDGSHPQTKSAALEALYKITGAVAPKRLRTKSDWLEYFSKHPAKRWGR